MTQTSQNTLDHAAEILTADEASLEETVESLERPVSGTIDWLVDYWEELLIGGVVALGLAGILLILRSLGRRYRKATKDRTSWKGIVAGVLAKTTLTFMLVTSFFIVVSHTEIPANLERIFEIAFIVSATLQGAIWARELIIGVIKSKAATEEDDPDSTLGNALNIIRVLVNVAVFAIAIIVILDNLGVDVTTLVAGLGIGGIAIGLAAQGIFSDLFAALSIVFDRPFRRGDVINYGGAAGTFGTVEKIGLKTTRLRAPSGELVVIGNTQLLEQEVKNIALAERRRVEIPFGVIYQTPPELLGRMKALVESTIADHEDITPVRTICTGFGDSSIDFLFIYDHYTTDYEELVGAKSLVLIAITRLFAEQGIEFAYPTQTTFTSAPDGTMIMPYPENGFRLVEEEAAPAPSRPLPSAATSVKKAPPRGDGDIEGPGASDTGGSEG
ncbi:mechanosensitive ion channel family protein [Sphingomicrobium astaxanthinifaciens]|uniref:mechanosensitive ion channel family protein n=1 Tax=Sphingomicrobium astaxanthinifaciens TaxID=1227949 RepID=UPI001FCC8CB8|nr:mechanosensitive ion channel domain-containing protein [Sphingomicrobium astaxanthinifaciens]MCJ7420549.1 mechanosensitive ion channel family protein [Sphingomicrobium astaxanthinifaciens]